MFDAPSDVEPEVLKQITEVMCNCIPNDVGVRFASDVEVSPYWGGKFSVEQIRLLNEGKLDWRKVFEEEVQKKLAKFGIEYKPGTFFEIGEEEVSVAMAFAKEGIEYKAGTLADEEDEDEDTETEEVA